MVKNNILTKIDVNNSNYINNKSNIIKLVEGPEIEIICDSPNDLNHSNYIYNVEKYRLHAKHANNKNNKLRLQILTFATGNGYYGY